MNLNDLIEEWVNLYNKSESALEQYAVLRIALEQIESLLKMNEKVAIADALEKYTETGDRTVYKQHGLSLHVRFNNYSEPSDEIDEINRQIQELEQQIKNQNADKINECLARKNVLIKQLENLETTIAINSTSPELERLKNTLNELLRSHSVKRVNLVGKYRPISPN